LAQHPGCALGASPAQHSRPCVLVGKPPSAGVPVWAAVVLAAGRVPRRPPAAFSRERALSCPVHTRACSSESAHAPASLPSSRCSGCHEGSSCNAATLVIYRNPRVPVPSPGPPIHMSASSLGASRHLPHARVAATGGINTLGRAALQRLLKHSTPAHASMSQHSKGGLANQACAAGVSSPRILLAACRTLLQYSRKSLRRPPLPGREGN